MHSPESCKGSFIDRVVVFASNLSSTIDTKLELGYLRLKSGGEVVCPLSLYVKKHKLLDSEGKLFFESAYQQIAEELAKGYREKGWKVEITYLEKGKSPVLKFKMGEQTK